MTGQSSVATPRGRQDPPSPESATTTAPAPGPPSVAGRAPLLRLAPPRARPGPGLAQAGGGASALAVPGLFPLVVVAARARKRTGAAAEAAEAPRAGRGCGAVLDSACPVRGPGSHASPGPGPAGGLPAGLGGAAAGLPDHPGECQCGRPLTLSHVSLARGQGSGSRGSAVGGSGSRVGDPSVAPEGGEAPGPGGPGWTLPSASNECPAAAPIVRAAAATLAETH